MGEGWCRPTPFAASRPHQAGRIHLRSGYRFTPAGTQNVSASSPAGVGPLFAVLRNTADIGSGRSRPESPLSALQIPMEVAISLQPRGSATSDHYSPNGHLRTAPMSTQERNAILACEAASPGSLRNPNATMGRSDPHRMEC